MHRQTVGEKHTTGLDEKIVGGPGRRAALARDREAARSRGSELAGRPELTRAYLEKMCCGSQHNRAIGSGHLHELRRLHLPHSGQSHRSPLPFDAAPYDGARLECLHRHVAGGGRHERAGREAAPAASGEPRAGAGCQRKRHPNTPPSAGVHQRAAVMIPPSTAAATTRLSPRILAPQTRPK